MFYHIIDHQGFGTMHKLIGKVCEGDSLHKMILYNDEEEIQNIVNDRKANIIIHSTASKNSNFIYDFLKYFTNRRVYIFMHVSLQYEIYKGRSDLIKYLRELTSTNNVVVLTPSKEVTEQYIQNNIKARTIQLGVDFTQIERLKIYRDELAQYYNKIITTCSSDNDVYKYIKGIDLYEDFIIKNGLMEYSLVAGTDNSNNTKIFCKRFAEEDFLNILAHSKMYVQFSRFESYNTTAAYAKVMKIPVLLMNAEGTFSCMNGNVYNKAKELEQKALEILMTGPNSELIELLYEDSLIRENLDNFKKEFERLNEEGE